MEEILGKGRERRHVHAIVFALSRMVHRVNGRVWDGSCFLWQKRFDGIQSSVMFCPLPPVGAVDLSALVFLLVDMGGL